MTKSTSHADINDVIFRSKHTVGLPLFRNKNSLIKLASSSKWQYASNQYNLTHLKTHAIVVLRYNVFSQGDFVKMVVGRRALE